jgi:hypothetical protein
MMIVESETWCSATKIAELAKGGASRLFGVAASGDRHWLEIQVVTDATTGRVEILPMNIVDVTTGGHFKPMIRVLRAGIGVAITVMWICTKKQNFCYNRYMNLHYRKNLFATTILLFAPYVLRIFIIGRIFS